MELLLNSLVRTGREYPDQIAVREAQRSITYGELLQLIDHLADWFASNDLKKGDRVCIHLVNSIDYVCAYYACWKVNLVPVALNMFASHKEIQNWIANSQGKLVLSNKLTDDAYDIPVYSISTNTNGLLINNKKIPENVSQLPEQILDSEDIATIIYTSGTTGNPKGITLTHKNLSANVQAIINSLAIEREDVFLCVLPFFYSFGNSILHTHLATGATLVLQNSVMYPIEILKTIAREKCTGFAGVPSIYISLLKKTDFTHHDLSSLRYMTQAGGPLSVEFIEQIRERLPNVDFVVMYGQTEASARISYLPPEKLETKMGSVGIGIDGVSISIYKPDGEECPVNETGEICITGDNVMQGYWNNPEATSRVIDHGKLKTGDMGYLDEEGYLYIVGRQSEILKISEHRVSPYEIEEALLLHPDVEECAVVGCSHAQSGQFAKAFIVKNGSEVSINHLKKFCKQHLANYKIPKEIEFIDCLPKTTSGKIKRSMLSC